ncbi:MAG: hypothetical protein N2C14_13105, partial [Planctomycetales bacterium]
QPCGNACNVSCEENCNQSGLFVSGELMFFKYHRADGVRVGGNLPAENADFNYELTPRFTAGWAGRDGLGVRGRYWQFDHAAGANEGGGSHIEVDTYTIDLEAYDLIDLNCDWQLEISGGVRYNDFRESLFNPALTTVHTSANYGGIVGLEAIRSVTDCLAVWGRFRGSLLMGDRRSQDGFENMVLRDATQGVLELSIGSEYNQKLSCGSVVFVRSSAEWQHWMDYTSEFDLGIAGADVEGAGDVGFGGFGIQAGIRR